MPRDRRSHLKNRGDPPEASEDDAGIRGYFEEDDRRIGARNRFMRWFLLISLCRPQVEQLSR